MRIYNSLGGRKADFEPIVGNSVSIYACGITPYSASHLGHGVAAIRFNMIRRYLQYLGYEVRFVQNITNVDDKIIAAGRAAERSPIDIGRQYAQEYAHLLWQLDIEPPDDSPDVLSYLTQIIEYVSALVDRGYAYPTAEGNVYFDVRKATDYGKLSGRRLNELLDGVRIVNDEEKHHPSDFALWKRDEHEEMSWDSPWGRGRPGWHIECSVMSNAILGSRIDIHCGGLDLIFPHHENEIAQCEAHNGCAFANYWVHSGLLNLQGKKMSKSLGNSLTLQDAIDSYGGDLIKLAVLRHHYASAINWNSEIFEDNLNPLLCFIRAFQLVAASPELLAGSCPADGKLAAEFEKAMDDDFNTPLALAVLAGGLDAALDVLESGLNSSDTIAIIARVRTLMNAMGMFMDAQSYDKSIDKALRFHASLLGQEALTQMDINHQINVRHQARKAGDFPRADAIRDRLHNRGIKLLDSPHRPTTWQFSIQAK